MKTLSMVKLLESKETPAINGRILQTGKTDSDGENFVNLITVAGVINVGDVLVGADSGTTAEVVSFDSRMLINVDRGCIRTRRLVV